MKHIVSDFTRGSQIYIHGLLMYFVGLKYPAIFAVFVFIWLAWSEVTGSLSEHQLYLIWMKLYASVWAFMEFDSAKHVTIQSGLGGTFELAIARVAGFPPVVEAWAGLTAALRRAAWLALLVSAPISGGYYWYAVRFGKRSKATRHQRGARLVDTPELVAQIEQNNQAERARELTKSMGWRWRLASAKELAATGIYRPFSLAGVSWPWRQEQTHAMLVGSTGTGKTVAMMDLLDQIRARGHRSIVFDLTGAYISTYFDPTRDTILHPLDARCPRWSIFDECRNPAEFTNAAHALVPHDGGGSEQFWVQGARTIFVAMCVELMRRGEGSNEALAKRLMTADLAAIHAVLKDTIAGPLTAPDAARMAHSVLAVFNVNAQALLYLPKTGPRFSIRKWVWDETKDGSILFISARYIDLPICRQLLTLWLDSAVNTLMSLPTCDDLRLWFLLDELGALHRLPALEGGMQTARNYGGAFVTGIHTSAKLKEVYGENGATTLSSVAKTKLILGNSDRESATWGSDAIGYGEITDMNDAYSFGLDKSRDSVSVSPDRREARLVLPDEILKLDPLHGYICFPGNLPTAPVTLVPRSRPRIAAGFIPRADFDGDWTAGNTAVPGPRGGCAHGSPAAAPGSESNGDGEGGGEGGKAPQVRQESFDFADRKGSGQDDKPAVEPSAKRDAEQQQQRLREVASAPVATPPPTPPTRPSDPLDAGPHGLQRDPGSGLHHASGGGAKATGKPAPGKTRPSDPELFSPTGSDQRDLPDVGEFGLGE